MTSPTSPTVRTCSCTGSGSRTCPRSGSPGGVGPHDAGSLRRHAAGVPGVPARRRHRRRGDRRHARHPRGGRALPGRPRVLEPAPQVQDLDQRMHRRLHEPGDQRHLVQRGHRPRRRARLRPVRRRRSVHQPDVRPAPGRLRGTRPRRRGVGGRDRALPRVRLPSLAQPRAPEVPGQGLGSGTRSRGAGDRVPGLAVAGRARTDGRADRERATTWASRRCATAAWRWGSRREPVGSPGTSSG